MEFIKENFIFFIIALAFLIGVYTIVKDIFIKLFPSLNNKLKKSNRLPSKQNKIKGSKRSSSKHNKIKRMVSKKNLAGLMKLLTHLKLEYRIESARKLGTLGDKRAIEPLIKALNDRDNRVRKNAAEALDKLNWKCEDKEVLAKYHIIKGDFNACERIGSSAVIPLLDVLKKEYDKNVIEILGKIGDARAVAPLIQVLNKAGLENRLKAIEALSNIGDDLAIEPLIEALKEKDKIVSKKATEALEDLNWKCTDKEILATYYIAKGQYNKCVKIGSDAVPPLLKILKVENDKNVCKRVIKALSEIGDVRAVDPIKKILVGKDHDLRQIATDALGKIGDKRAVDPLIKTLKYGDKNDQKNAAEALEKMEWQFTDKKVLAIYHISKGNFKECKKIGSEAVAPLLKVVRERSSETRSMAVDALCDIRDPEAVEPMICGLLNKSIDDLIKARIAETIIKIMVKELVFDSIKIFDICKVLNETENIKLKNGIIEILDKIKYESLGKEINSLSYICFMAGCDAISTTIKNRDEIEFYRKVLIKIGYPVASDAILKEIYDLHDSNYLNRWRLASVLVKIKGWDENLNEKTKKEIRSMNKKFNGYSYDYRD